MHHGAFNFKLQLAQHCQWHWAAGHRSPPAAAGTVLTGTGRLPLAVSPQCVCEVQSQPPAHWQISNISLNEDLIVVVLQYMSLKNLHEFQVPWHCMVTNKSIQISKKGVGIGRKRHKPTRSAASAYSPTP